MNYVLFGRSGLRVSEVGLGTMTFGDDWGWGADRDESRRIFDTFAEAGGNFIDTSCNYTNGTSERFVGEFTSADRDHFVIATKYTLNTRRDDPNFGGNHRKNLRRSLTDSLERLRTDHVDVLYLHAWDGTIAPEDVMRWLDDEVRTGRVLHVAISDTPAWIVSRAVTIAELRGLSPFVALQVPYSLAARDVERELLPMAHGLGLAVTPFSVLGGGVLTGKYNRENGSEPRRFRGTTAERLSLAEVVAGVADEVGRNAAQVAVNWVRAQRHRATLVPLLGARTAAQLEDNLKALEFELTDEHVRRLDEASGFRAGFPSDFLNSDMVQELLWGDTRDRVQRPLINH